MSLARHHQARITVVLADDHAILREGLRLVLESAGDIQVIGEAENGLQAVAAVKALRPDVLVLDLAMPVLNGKEAARQILKEAPQTCVLILSSYSDAQHVQDLVNMGIHGYLLKLADAPEISQAIRAVKKGKRFFSPSIAQPSPAHSSPGSPKTGEIKMLTVRETQVLQLIAEGYPNKGIAPVLGISIKTVEKHRQSVMDKLNLHDTAGLTRYAVSHGLLKPGGTETQLSV